MNYYNEIKEKLIKSEIYDKVNMEIFLWDAYVQKKICQK